jgi:hypothetical protein
VLVEPPEETAVRSLPVAGPGCGDIVVCVSAADLERLRRTGRDRWDRHLYVHRNRPPASYAEGLDPTDLSPGAGVWLAHDGRVCERLPLASSEHNPNGTLLFLALDATAPSPAGPECQPFTGWRWRWWALT